MFSVIPTAENDSEKSKRRRPPIGQGLSLSLSLSLSTLSIITAFSRWTWVSRTRMSPFWILLELRMTEVVATTAAIRRRRAPVTCHHQQTTTQFFLQTGCPSRRPTDSVRAYIFENPAMCLRELHTRVWGDEKLLSHLGACLSRDLQSSRATTDSDDVHSMAPSGFLATIRRLPVS